MTKQAQEFTRHMAGMICMFACMFATQAGDSIPIDIRLGSSQQAIRRFATEVYEHPAMRRTQYDHTLTRVALDGMYNRQNEAVQMQLGDGVRAGRVEADTYTQQTKSTLWGGASYENGRRMNTRFNETGDYERLAPYVMGDSVGGNLSTQTYRFHGGFARTVGPWIIGGEAAFRAVLEYRRVDPRPLNTVSDFNGKAGASVALPAHYRAGFSLNAGRYKQTNGLKFFSELGVPNVLHFTGLGTDYYRFRGSRHETYYNGYNIGAALNLLCEATAGWRATLRYDYTSDTKIMSSLNNLPLSHLGSHTFVSEVAYVCKEERFWGVTLRNEDLVKQGTENLFGDAANNIYPQIASTRKYTNLRMRHTIEGLYGRRRPTGSEWHIAPVAGYEMRDERYLSSARSLRLSHLFASVKGGWLHETGRWLVCLDGAAQFNLSAGSDMEMPDTVTTWDEPTHNLFKHAGGHYTVLRVQATVWYSMNTHNALSFSADYEACLYESGNRAQQVECSIAFSF